LFGHTSCDDVVVLCKEENEKKEKGKEEEEEVDDMAWLRAKQGIEPEQDNKKNKKKKKDDTNSSNNNNNSDVYNFDEPPSFAVHQAETTAKIAETRRLFVRNLPLDTDEAALRQHCAQFGEITECVLPLSAKTKMPKVLCCVF
jgi:RNA recognition motif-containing protein